MLITSLQEEVLAANPFQADQVRSIDEYCGIIDVNGMTAQVETEGGTETVNVTGSELGTMETVTEIGAASGQGYTDDGGSG